MLRVILDLVLLGLTDGERPRAAAPPLTLTQILHGKCFKNTDAQTPPSESSLWV